MAGLKSVDKNLPPIVPHSINDWVKRFDKLREGFTEANEQLACTFALTGHYTDENGQAARAKLDLSDRAIRPDLVVHQVCDIDSVIGIITGEFPIQDAAVFQYHLINDFAYCLTSDLHIPGWLDRSTQGTSNQLVPYHKIPHAVFGTVDNGRTIVRIFLPEANEEGSDNVFLTKQFLEPLYDLAVKPAAQEVVTAHYMRTWPPSYAAEEARAARRVGKPQFSGKALRGVHLKALIGRVLEIVARDSNLTFARGCFWMVEMKGVKAYTTHPPPARSLLGPDGRLSDPLNSPRILALNKLFENWQWAEFKNDCWYLDIATTVSVTRADGSPVSVLIRKDAHPEILRHFTKEPIQRCIAWASRDNGRDYQFDAMAHLEQVGGCRLTIFSREEKPVRYFQAYTTEKSLTYHRDGASVALNSSAWRTMENWEQEDKRFFQPAIKTFHQASDEGTTSHIASRFESRTNFENFALLHLLIPEANVRSWLYFADTRAIWGIKTRRMHGIREPLKYIMTHRPLITWKHLPQVSSLVIILVWAANALANRPAEGGTWNEVRDSGSIHQLDQSGQLVPCQPLGLFMLHSLVTHPTYRLSGDRTISMDTIMRLVFTRDKNATIADLYILLNPVLEPSASRQLPAIQWGDEPEPGPRVAQRASNNNKRQRINLHASAPAPAVFGSLAGQIAIAGLDDQDEESCSSEEDDDEERHQSEVTYKEISEVLQNVAVQIFAKAPNRAQGRECYCLLTELEKLEVTNDIFKTKKTLSATWESYTIFNDSGKWQNTVERLFPTRQGYHELTTDRDGKKVQVQGLSTMEFWTSWQVILTRVSPELEKNIVKAMHTHINNTWHWFPAIEGRKLWNTARRPGKQHVGKGENGPWIACNPRFLS
ncbi:hypothetical protein FRC08_018700 [Ceratobasidium sp. 394]|nr:hypothetical protein FRC08_018700 [Ceratobasidium sp. 394]